MHSPVKINIAVEGSIDVAVAERLIIHAGGSAGMKRSANGKHRLEQNLGKYRAAAENGMPWLVLRDLDNDAVCAGQYLQSLNMTPCPNFCLRIAVREIESWLLADREGIARFLRISPARIDRNPENLNDPKRRMVDLARRSGSREIVAAMVPDENSGRSEGPEYAAFLTDFVTANWDLAAALRSGASMSLIKADSRIREFITALSPV